MKDELKELREEVEGMRVKWKEREEGVGGGGGGWTERAEELERR